MGDQAPANTLPDSAFSVPPGRSPPAFAAITARPPHRRRYSYHSEASNFHSTGLRGYTCLIFGDKPPQNFYGHDGRREIIDDLAGDKSCMRAMGLLKSRR